jgi:hypothetical protein
MPSAELLTPPHNYAVVQLPDRKFPGVVFQGDSLFAVLMQLRELRPHIANDENAKLGFSDLLQLFEDVVAGYEHACATHGIPLPYVKAE